MQSFCFYYQVLLCFLFYAFSLSAYIYNKRLFICKPQGCFLFPAFFLYTLITYSPLMHSASYISIVSINVSLQEGDVNSKFYVF